MNYETMNPYSKITPDIVNLTSICKNNSSIDPALYTQYDVKRGLRDINGKGVLAGLTEIGNVKSYEKDEFGNTTPCEGKLYYRGYDVQKLVKGFVDEDRFGFEETVYLLLMGNLPNKEQLNNFTELLGSYRTLPTNFVRDIILKAPSKDMMITMAKSILNLYSYDDLADDTSIENVMRQSIQLISLFPMIAVYGYQAYRHYHCDDSLIIHTPDPSLSTAENILHLLRNDSKYTPFEAKILDIALVLHAEHGGGNNSTFTTHVVSSSGTDTYSCIAASLSSLKGPKHGGANIKVVKMFEDMKKNIADWTDEEAVSKYLSDLLNKRAFDNAGLIYGMGHAVYSISDPRAETFKGFVEKLAIEKGREKEFKLHSLVEKLAPKIIGNERHIYKGVSANVDFYSGFVYGMLDLPPELFTPIFAIARISGWCAHRMEELLNAGKIIRPAYMAVAPITDYVPLNER